MIRTSRLTFLLFLACGSVFCEYHGSVSSVFGSLRRTDNSAAKTYHFYKVNTFEPVNEPLIYEDSYNDDTKMIVGFRNMVIFGMFQNEKHYVIRVNADLDQDDANIPREFLNGNDDSGELFDVVTLKPTPTTPTTTARLLYRDSIRNIQREALRDFERDTEQ